mmetsp:Transcript_54154/g.144280  ORF Transcript_54154/g.144280 Transcript_54154/m.144280 type:complete len:213 (-) Transcript_54154:375-1013(-)
MYPSLTPFWWIFMQLCMKFVFPVFFAQEVPSAILRANWKSYEMRLNSACNSLISRWHVMSVSRRTGFNSLASAQCSPNARDQPQAPVGFALLDLTRLLLADSLLKLVRFRKEVHPICSVLARKTLALLQALEYFDDQLVLVLHNHAVDDLENTHENFIDLGLLAELRTRCRSSLALDCCHRSRSDVSFSARRQDRQQRRHWCSPHWQFRHGL